MDDIVLGGKFFDSDHSFLIFRTIIRIRGVGYMYMSMTRTTMRTTTISTTHIIFSTTVWCTV